MTVKITSSQYECDHYLSANEVVDVTAPLIRIRHIGTIANSTLEFYNRSPFLRP